MQTETVDVLAVGAGPGGLLAGMVARARGRTPLVIEKSEWVGGTSSQSFGGLWFADNPLMREIGQTDSVEDGLTYLEHVVGDGTAGPAATRERQEIYLRTGLRMLEFLEERGCEFIRISGYPDYYPEAPGGRQAGRVFDSPLFDARRLGPWQDWVRPRKPLPMGLVIGTIEEFRAFPLASRNVAAAKVATRAVLAGYWMKLRGVKPLVLGAAYIGQLLLAAQRERVEIRRRTAMRELLVEGDRVVGVVAECDGVRTEIRSRGGVLLNTGGFARDAELRAKFGHPEHTAEWTFMVEGDTGDGFRVATGLGAAISCVDEAYWLPGILDAHGEPQLMLPERHQPHSIVVDHSGARFTNEAVEYMGFGQAIVRRDREVPCIPAWLIVDGRHRKRYPLGFAMPRLTPRKWLASGYLKRSDTLEGLARECGIDPAGLAATVARFNEQVAAGRDSDFGRGDSLYDRVYGDPAVTPNPCLGTIAEPPFYAAQIVPSDIGMAGGLVTDTHGRVLREDGTVIPGLYACGTAAASAMGRCYAGGGISLGQSSVFGMLAAEDMCGAPGAG
jgi:3-oxosteroid 1-dehydrogenase